MWHPVLPLDGHALVRHGETQRLRGSKCGGGWVKCDRTCTQAQEDARSRAATGQQRPASRARSSLPAQQPRRHPCCVLRAPEPPQTRRSCAGGVEHGGGSGAWREAWSMAGGVEHGGRRGAWWEATWAGMGREAALTHAGPQQVHTAAARQGQDHGAAPMCRSTAGHRSAAASASASLNPQLPSNQQH